MSTTTTQSAILREQMARLAGTSTARDDAELPALAVAPVTLASTIKRAMDLAGSLVGLALLAPVLATVALLVRLSSPGPIFFRQLRLGQGGRPFYVLKFRTMVADAEMRLKDLEAKNEAGGVLFKIKDDPRVTPIGRFLRRTSLDELPQLINVVEGSMSLVGPRPHASAHNEHYRKLIRGYMLRHKVKPGITGLAQVNGCRGETRTVEKMRRRIELDHQYIREWSFTLDLRILLKTLRVAWRQPEAY
jgi:putative colanic acid biosynthesis UDP-glucose lipid carrier transferase